MKILQVIHGYPPAYSAGSEVYTQTIARGLRSAGHEVRVFTREDDPFRRDYEVRLGHDPSSGGIKLHLINMPRCGEAYRHDEVDHEFDKILNAFRPDVVHVGHLHHLSTSLVEVAYRRKVPLVYTLHDFWLMCPRGQFLQTNPGGEAWSLCDGQEDRKCAMHCFGQYRTGDLRRRKVEEAYWTDWVRCRMNHVRRMTSLVDVFVAPSQTVLRRFRDEFGIPKSRLVHLDYGFDQRRLWGRGRTRETSFVFGYIGTHIPAKGIPVLLDAFAQVEGKVKLRIWGRPNGSTTAALRERAASLPSGKGKRVHWMGGYDARYIVTSVLNRVDALVVPSIWLENSPLVIHEAQQARIPVIASNLGGMAEYVQHGVNGLLFEARNPSDLAAQMQRLANAPALARRLGGAGYLWTDSHDVQPIEEHVRELVSIYKSAIHRRKKRGAK